jgi:hypothetical protein
MFKKVSHLILAVVITAQTNLFVLNAFAAGAVLSVSAPADVNLVKGCPSTINVLLNTGGDSIQPDGRRDY